MWYVYEDIEAAEAHIEIVNAEYDPPLVHDDFEGGGIHVEGITTAYCDITPHPEGGMWAVIKDSKTEPHAQPGAVVVESINEWFENLD